MVLPANSISKFIFLKFLFEPISSVHFFSICFASYVYLHTHPVNRFIRATKDIEQKNKWERVKESLLKEVQLIKSLSAEIVSFHNPSPERPLSRYSIHLSIHIFT